MNNRSKVGLTVVGLLAFAAFAASASIEGSKKEGLVEYAGAQKHIFKTGKAGAVMYLEDLAGKSHLFAIGPIEGLDGEITIFDSKPYITQVRGSETTIDNTLSHGAIFLVWSEQAKWQDIKIPTNIRGYLDLQNFVKAQAQAAKIDTKKPFPFLLSGSPIEIKWHINIDRTEGKRITQELFVKSKEGFVMKNEPVDIIGFYAESHPGEFISQYAPAIPLASGMQNFIHIHMVSKTGKAAGHIDDITLAEGMVLRLPK